MSTVGGPLRRSLNLARLMTVLAAILGEVFGESEWGCQLECDWDWWPTRGGAACVKALQEAGFDGQTINDLVARGIVVEPGDSK